MSAPRLETPIGWHQQRGDGYVLHIDPARDEALAFALSVAAGLDAQPRTLDARYLYDDAGSALFERITAQPEYYPTRTEERLLAAHAHEICRRAGLATLVELGSGSSVKTRHLLDAWTTAGPTRYWPIDVSAAALEPACRALARRYCGRGLTVEGVAGAYDRALPVVAGAAPMLLVFLGSSLGNLGRHGQNEFLEMVAANLRPGDGFLLGLDHVKEPARLEAAYDDAAGVTAAFTRNLFSRMNRELGAGVPLEHVRHVAYWNDHDERVEIFAEFTREVALRLEPLGRTFRLARGERVRTELAYKYRPEIAAAAIARHGFELAYEMRDESSHYGLMLFRRRAAAPRRAPDLHTALARTRARTLELVAPLSEAELVSQPNPLMSPLVWDLGHIANFESTWLLRKLEGARPGPRPETARLDALYDPQATPRAGRQQLALPTPAETRAYLADVRASAFEVVARLEGGALSGPLAQGGCVVELVVQHEAQHQETMLQALALRDDRPYRPGFAAPTAPALTAVAREKSVLVPAGPFRMGSDDTVVAYDNERPAHTVDLPAFRLDVAPVSNADFARFIADGGYTRRELWTPEGWAWRLETGATAPGHWRGAEVMVFGARIPRTPDAPVVHVSWFEADAYARWAGQRLPTEAEWEKAAAWDVGREAARRYPWGDEAPTAAHANLDQRLLEPAAIGAYPRGRSPYGCLHMLGDVWEWTDTWFAGYPGFRSFPYREYSEIFFGERYRVLRGGSFATAASVARNTFRNWDFPERRQIFAGFRCASDL